ncbi:MAG: phosphonatase-like hydrolase [Isosphaeraceae bacterium]
MSASTPRPIELVVFDMAGTTVEDHGVVNRCFRDTLAGSGLAVEPEAVDAVMGLPKPEAFRRLIGASALADVMAARVSAIHAEFVNRMVEYYEQDAAVREVPGVAELFAALRRAGVKVALDTGFSRPIADAIITRLGWNDRGLIDASVTSDEVANGRPFPDMIERLVELLGISTPQAVAKVGDAPADLEEGLAARCRWVIGVTWGTHSRAQLEKHPHTHLVDTVAELARLLESGSPS